MGTTATEAEGDKHVAPSPDVVQCIPGGWADRFSVVDQGMPFVHNQ